MNETLRESLTRRQQQILDLIRNTIEQTGMPPTRADICEFFGFRSPTAAEDHLRALDRKGYIELLPGRSRGIRLVLEDALSGLPLVGRVAAGAPMLAEQNVETLNGYGASNKTVITACPHCFNTLANEYAAFGGKYDVVHHSAFLNGLLAQGRLVPSRRVAATVAYHDSCYLGRYNEVYEEPREVLQSIPGVKLVEVEYWNRERGLCCGMGGGQAFKEEEHGSERVSAKRTLQLIDTGADTIATGCPFCTIALDESLKSLDDAEDGMTQLDVALLLERSVDFDKATVEDAAE